MPDSLGACGGLSGEYFIHLLCGKGCIAVFKKGENAGLHLLVKWCQVLLDLQPFFVDGGHKNQFNRHNEFSLLLPGAYINRLHTVCEVRFAVIQFPYNFRRCNQKAFRLLEVDLLNNAFGFFGVIFGIFPQGRFKDCPCFFFRHFRKLLASRKESNYFFLVVLQLDSDFRCNVHQLKEALPDPFTQNRVRFQLFLNSRFYCGSAFRRSQHFKNIIRTHAV